MSEVTKTIPISKILLDPENPRHIPISDQTNIIKWLLEKESIKALAKDIAVNGLSPLEQFGVYKTENAKYIVAEGNRRLCALKLINSPRLCPSPQLKNYFEKLKAISIAPNKIKCTVFPDKESARPWLERRHNGPQDGVGLRSWDSTQKGRFFDKPEDRLAINLIDFAVEQRLISQQEAGNTNLTTATRYLSSPVVRKAIGIVSGRSDKEIKINLPTAKFKLAVEKFLSDIATGANGVSSRSNKEDREIYAKSFQNSGLISQHDYGGTVVLSADETEKEELANEISSAKTTSEVDSASSEAENTPPKRNTPTQSTKKRNTVAGTNPNLKISEPKINNIYLELRKLKSAEYPIAGAALIRALVDTTTTEFVNTFGLAVTRNQLGQMELKPRINATFDYFKNLTPSDPSGREACKLAAVALISKEGLLNIDHLHLNLHGKFFQIEPGNLMRGWDQIYPWLEAMWVKIVLAKK